jgi:phosphoribosylaminoimidazole-succinocarboxamide synthase
MKFECGMVDERLVIIDDISTDNMRVMREGRMLSPQELLELTVGSPSD